MPMYNLLEYSKNYRKTTGSLWNYYRDEPNNPPLNDDDPPTINYNADPITNSESFKYKSSITGKTSNANNGTEQRSTKIKKNFEIVVPLKYLSNFWRSSDMPLINCEISLTLTWYGLKIVLILLLILQHKLQQQLKEVILQEKE